MTNLEGQTLGGCEILARLGEGSVGLVYKARQRPPDRHVAVQVLDTRLAKEAGYLSRFKRDAALVATLHHPNLVQLHAVGEQKGTHYVVTEFVEGETLREQIQRRGRLGAREALAIVYYVARALLYGWSKLKLAHLDVRPENIFVLPSADVKLGDLGIAKPPVGERTGLPHYTAPEQAAGGADFRADIYSVGCVLYHMLTGRTPYGGRDAKTLLAQQAGDPLPGVTKLWPACPASLERLLGKMMAKQPGDRFRSYDDLIQELLQVRDEVKRAAQPHATVQASAGSRHFAGYTLLGKLGQDDVGVDYEAFEPAAHRIVVLKVLAPRFSRVPALADRFKRGMAAVMRLSHDNIRPVFAADEADGACYIASEFIEGRTLRQRLERRGQLQPREALAIAVYVAQALQHAWNSARMPHGAISSDTVMLVRGGTVKVGDFGLARILETETGATDRTGPARCSSHYMSPEQARGVTELDCRADIYGLGCLLYHMLTGRTPYTGDHSAAIVAKHNSEPPPSILKAWPGCPSSLAGLMDRMLAKSRSGRPQTYEELMGELVKVREEFRRVKVVAPPPPETKPADQPGVDEEEPAADETEAKPSGWDWKPMLVGAGIGLVVVFGGLLVWAPWKKTSDLGSSPEAWHTEHAHSRIVPLSETLAPRHEAGPGNRGPETVAAYKAPVSRSAPPAPKPEKKTVAPVRPPPVPAETAAAKTSDTSSATDRLMAPHATMAKAGSEIMIDVTSGTASKGKPMTDEAFAESIPSLLPQEQVRRVIARLQELNPGFDGKANYKIEGGAVTEVAISTTGTLVPTVGVSDLVPLRALKGLQRLVVAPAKPDEPGALSDLSALSGMRLTWLYCHGNPQLHDLSPLRDMPLTTLSCGGTQVKDLSPLSGMRLTTLAINDTLVEDISALSGMPLVVLWCNNTKITGLSALKGMPLRELRCDFVRTRDEALLRGIPTLARINDLPVAVFWKKAQTATAVPAATTGRALRTAVDFKALFNGKDMNQWRPRSISAPNGWRVRRSSMINTPPSNDLESKDKFHNFEFYCEFQLDRRSGSGVLLRGVYRIPLLNDMAYMPSKTCSGSVAGLIAPTKNAAKPAETWQALYVKLVDETVTVILNNKKVIDARNLYEASGSTTVEDVVSAGPIILQGHGGVTFRNLRIKELRAE